MLKCFPNACCRMVGIVLHYFPETVKTRADALLKSFIQD
jgi:hypothetical protein